MKWSIVTDSSCDLQNLETGNEQIIFSIIPFTISVGNRDFIDDMNLNVNEMIVAMDLCKEASHTSCPAPYAWYKQFEKADNSIAITISSQVSGSYNSALAARNMILEKYPDKKIAVLDSHTAGPEIILMIQKLCELIKSQQCFNLIVKAMDIFRMTRQRCYWVIIREI